MRKLLLSTLLFSTLSASAQVEWDSLKTTIDTVSSAGGSFSVSSGWTFQTAEEYDQSDFIQAKADQFYVSVERRPDSLPQVGWRLVQKRLGPDEVFFDFMYTDFNDKATFLTSVIRRSGLPQVLVVPTTGPGKAGKSVYAASRGIHVDNSSKVGSYLEYNNLMAFLEPQLAGVKTIYYSTSNDLNLVNLKFLKSKDGKFLFEKYNLVRLHSGASFLGNRHRLVFPRKMKVLLVGNVCYECDGSDPETYAHFWDALPGSRTEIRNIAALLKPVHQVDVLDSCKATEARFVAQVNTTSYDIVHLATHGFFFKSANERYGLAANAYPLFFTGIVLSGANSRETNIEPNNERGMFTAMDFRKLDVSNIRLMVLSTCYSGDGETTHSSAPFGLTLALLRRGIHAMVLSNRAIPDQETTEFMTAFYRQLTKVPDADAAFTNTLRELKSTKPQVDWSFMDLVH